MTGDCKKCINNSAGDRCEICKSGFFGDAVDKNIGCQACQCYKAGTLTDQVSGTWF